MPEDLGPPTLAKTFRRILFGLIAAPFLLLVFVLLGFVFHFFQSGFQLTATLDKLMEEAGVSRFETVKTYYLDRRVFFGEPSAVWLVKIDEGEEFNAKFYSLMRLHGGDEYRAHMIRSLSDEQRQDLGGEVGDFRYFTLEFPLGAGTVCDRYDCNIQVLSHESVAYISIFGD
ncbi:MAG: hypothetical protein HUJ27_00590 [Rhodobacteraceae bacterium]|nr:hypothetical protein [Paracoccaceae bacterium]